MARIGLIGFTLVLTVLGVATLAEANQPPGPQLLLAEVGLLPFMILLSLVGGAYGVLRPIRPGARRWTLLRWAGAVLAILASGTSGGIAFLVAAIFGVLALQRGVQMVRWGIQARRSVDRPVHLAAASPRRLLPAGIVLLLGTVGLLGMVTAFATYWPAGEGPRQQALRQFVTYQLAEARRAEAKTGRARFRRADSSGAAQGACPVPFRLPDGARIEYAPDDVGFTLLLFPQKPFPFFPYNYLTSQPSYRADATGQIRMIEVHDRRTACPPDAPVVGQVSREEIERMQQMLETAGDCP
jgi:hypothetical protein